MIIKELLNKFYKVIKTEWNNLHNDFKILIKCVAGGIFGIWLIIAIFAFVESGNCKSYAKMQKTESKYIKYYGCFIKHNDNFITIRSYSWKVR